MSGGNGAEATRGLAADLLAGGLPPADVLARLVDRGVASEEAVRLVGEFVAFEPFTPLHELPAPAFPIDALPTWLRDFTEAEAPRTRAAGTATAGRTCAPAPSASTAKSLRGAWSARSARGS